MELARGRREYSPADHERFVEGMQRAFDSNVYARTAGAGLPTRQPVFVFGLPRSGTTLIEQVLASHSRICGAGELRLGRQSFEAIPGLLGCSESSFDCVPHGLDPAALRGLAERHEEQLQALAGSQAERIVDKMPDNYMYLGLLAALFPQAVFIHCRRDLRDVAVSCWMTDFSSIRWANTPEHIASRFGHYRRLMDHWRAVLPAPIHEVDYEETVADLEGVARRLLAACGQEWNPACLEFHRTNRPVRTASVAQVRQPVYKQSVARWKNYERELADLFAAPYSPTKSAPLPHPRNKAEPRVLDQGDQRPLGLRTGRAPEDGEGEGERQVGRLGWCVLLLRRGRRRLTLSTLPILPFGVSVARLARVRGFRSAHRPLFEIQ